MIPCPFCNNGVTVRREWFRTVDGPDFTEHDEPCDTCNGSGFIETGEPEYYLEEVAA